MIGWIIAGCLAVYAFIKNFEVSQHEKNTEEVVERIERILRVLQRRANITNSEQEYIDGNSSSL